MRMVMALARSRASFLTSCSSLRSCRVSCDFGQDLLGDLLVAVEEVQQFLAHPVDQVGADFGVAQLVLGLRFEHRVLEADRHRAHHAFAHVVALEFFPAVFVDRFEQAFPKRAQVRAAVAGVLAVDKGIEGLAVAAVAVGETELERLLGVMQRRVDGFAAVRLEVFHDQVQQAVAGLEDLAVENQLQAGVEIAVMAQPALDVFGLELDFLEDVRIGLEPDQRAVRFRRSCPSFRS